MANKTYILLHYRSICLHESVMNLLEANYLRLSEIVASRIKVVKFGVLQVLEDVLESRQRQIQQS